MSHHKNDQAGIDALRGEWYVLLDERAWQRMGASLEAAVESHDSGELTAKSLSGFVHDIVSRVATQAAENGERPDETSPYVALLDVELLALHRKLLAGSDDTAPRDAWHSLDFRYVRWYGVEYSFSPLQAACVAELWSAWEQRTPELSQHTILEEAGSDRESKRLDHVFRSGKKKHPALGTMIVRGTSKGTYRLNPPRL